MYFPYLRGKQFELLAIRELAPVLCPDKIVPIIEPVKSNIASLNTALAVLQKHNLQCQLIINPTVGDFKFNNDTLEQLVARITTAGSKVVIPSFIITSYKDFEYAKNVIERRGYFDSGYSLIHLNKVNNIDSLAQYSTESNCIYHSVHGAHLFTMRSRLGSNVCMLNDYFNKLRTNTEYISNPFEIFSSDYKYFKEKGCIGFADYQAIGKEYSEGGGAAYAVAIHLTFIDNNSEDIQIAHFVSDSNDGPEDPARKFFEALGKLVGFTEQYGFDSAAIRQFKQLYREQSYPGLGVVKKLSIMNHIEVVQNLI